MNKICGYCKQEKNISLFGKNNESSDGLRWECKECRKAMYYKNHDRELLIKKNDYLKHKKERLEKAKDYYIENSDHIKEKANNYYYKNKDKISERERKYRKKNKEKISLRKKLYLEKKCQEKLKQQEEFNKLLITVNYPDTYKICTKCRTLKLINKDNFNLVKDKRYVEKIIYRAECTECQSVRNKNHRIKNGEELRAKDRQKRAENPEFYRQQKKLKRLTPKSIEWNKQYKSRIEVKIKQAVSQRIRSGLKMFLQTKENKTIEYLGCDIQTLMTYLESKFTEGMNWENYGFGDDKWHIDHIKPCRAFDLTKEEEIYKCFNYTNLCPLWQIDNLKKNDLLLDGSRARELKFE